MAKQRIVVFGWTLALGVAFCNIASAQIELFAEDFEAPEQRKLTAYQAARFLSQATFGPSVDSIAALQQSTPAAWIDQQMALPPSLQRPFLENLSNQGVGINGSTRRDRWGWNATYGEDQLRQRVAWALIQVLVISADGMGSDHFGLTEYYDILTRNAFGNYRDILEEVSLSPQMGRYLSHLRNRKANPNRGTKPDENYAREIMQLFSIGLVKLNIDHTPILNNGEPVPTYDQDVISELAKVFTGWTYANSETFFRGELNYLPMVCYENEHEPGPKVILDGQVIPDGQTCEEDLQDALDIVFDHPNVGPFVSRQLIQRLVMSNPPPQYIARVATVFNNNGSGVRGDMGAVVRAILLDPVARQAPQATAFGKPREPLLKLIAMYRALDAAPPPNNRSMSIPFSGYGQTPLGSPTVFNFYSPNYQAPGEIQKAGLYSPEFQIVDEGTIATSANDLFNKSWNSYTAETNQDTNRPSVDVDDFVAMLGDAPALVDELDFRFMYGTMSSSMRQTLINLIESFPSNGNNHRKVLGVIHLVMLSPEFAVQR